MAAVCYSSIPACYMIFFAQEEYHAQRSPRDRDLLFATPSVLFSQQSADKVRARAAAYMAKLEHQEGFSGVALLARDGKILFARAYGMANLEHDVPNTLETKFRLGSMTKQFTAVGIMILQDVKS